MRDRYSILILSGMFLGVAIWAICTGHPDGSIPISVAALSIYLFNYFNNDDSPEAA